MKGEFANGIKIFFETEGGARRGASYLTASTIRRCEVLWTGFNRTGG
jgi:hypothetical protein